MKAKYILSIDQGTSGTKVLLIDKNKKIKDSKYKKHTQFYPLQGWNEHDPKEIWANIVELTENILKSNEIFPEQIEGIGLANQGETCLIWDKNTGEPLHYAILWSDTRTKDFCAFWKNIEGWEEKIQDKTGLHIDPYFSGTKFHWLLQHPNVKEKWERGEALLGTLDSWLLWRMTDGYSFVTDKSTASRTLLYNIHEEAWDEEIASYLGITIDYLPHVLENDESFGVTSPTALAGIESHIYGSMVDQPAALYGHFCFEKGAIKCTYGTGCFVYMNAGENIIKKENSNLLSSVVWSKNSHTTYSLDGSVYAAGAAVDWGKNNLHLYQDIAELQEWSKEWVDEMNHDSSLMFIPSFNGLGTPFWNAQAGGVYVGMNYATSKKEMAKAILEGIAHRVADVIEEMSRHTDEGIKALKVDGGLTINPYLMQYQADILGFPIQVIEEVEATSLGVGYLTGINLGWWTQNELTASNIKKVYNPALENAKRNYIRSRWKHLINNVNDFYSEYS